MHCLLLPLLLASYVSAHGFVYEILTDGKTFVGSVPNTQASNTPSIIRQVTTQDPVKGATNPFINCGSGPAFPASQVASVNPGDVLSFDWRDADLGNWPHNTGPILTYLANCGSTPCSSFDSTQAKWFKITQIGLKPNSNTWFQADIMAGGTTNATIPPTLAPGNYLVRHEIIALHLAMTPGGAEFYPSCAQIQVGGSQTGAPASTDLVSLPGSYSDTEPGILVPGIYNGNLNYQFPGPEISLLGGSPGAAPAPGSTATTSGSQPTSTSTSSGSSSGTKVCKLRKTSASAATATPSSTADVYPRHISRVMRRLAIDGFSARRSY